MRNIRLAFIVFLISTLTACANFYDGQPPAPVFGGENDDPYANEPYDNAQNVPDKAAQQHPKVLETKPLEGGNKTPEMVEIKPNLPPTDDLGGASEQSAGSNDPFGIGQPSEDPQMPETEPPAEQPKPNEIVQPVAPPVPEAPKEPAELVPLETFAPQSPAVGSLLLAANENSQGGNLDSAVSSIERAIRIEPRNAALYYKLAVLRLKQSKPRLAEDIARKAALLAVNDNALKKHSWLLIANARELQKNVDGAKKAKEEADKY
jgi:tetratricopeptide (TPR) repeat protein